MSTYKTLVDFRLFNHADMWEACKGFRSVIHKAIYTADVISAGGEKANYCTCIAGSVVGLFNS